MGTAELDHEVTPQYSIIVTATANGQESTSATVLIEVTDVNEPPVYAHTCSVPLLLLCATERMVRFPPGTPTQVTVSEDAPIGSDFGPPLTAIDSDSTDLEYSLLVDASQGVIGIRPLTGQLFVKG